VQTCQENSRSSPFAELLSGWASVVNGIVTILEWFLMKLIFWLTYSLGMSDIFAVCLQVSYFQCACGVDVRKHTLVARCLKRATPFLPQNLDTRKYLMLCSIGVILIFTLFLKLLTLRLVMFI